MQTKANKTPKKSTETSKSSQCSQPNQLGMLFMLSAPGCVCVSVRELNMWQSTQRVNNKKQTNVAIVFIGQFGAWNSGFERNCRESKAELTKKAEQKQWVDEQYCVLIR